MTRPIGSGLLAAALAVVATEAAALSIRFTDRQMFEAALDQSFFKLDTDTYVAANGAGPVLPGDADFLAQGMDVVNGAPGFSSFLVGLSSYPAHGPEVPSFVQFGGFATSDTSDDFLVNLTVPANGFGYVPNRIDQGDMTFYAGPDGTGDVIATTFNDGSGDYVGMIADRVIGSVRVTCTFDADFVCGLMDQALGLSSELSPAGAAVPLPAGAALLLTGVGALALRRRRRA